MKYHVSPRIGALQLKILLRVLLVFNLAHRWLFLVRINRRPYYRKSWARQSYWRRRAALLALRIGLTELDMNQDARLAMQAAINIMPSWPKAHLGAGLAAMRQNDPDHAALCFRTAIALNVRNKAYTRCELAKAYRGLQRSDLAVEEYLAALEQDPKYFPAFIGLQGLGFEAYHDNRIADAIRIYKASADTGVNSRIQRFHANADPNGPSFEQRSEALKQKLRKAWNDEDEGRSSLPRAMLEQNEDEDAETVIATFIAEKKRVLIVSSQYIAHNENYLKHDLTIAYECSALAAGIEHRIFFSDSFYDFRMPAGWMVPLHHVRGLEDAIAEYRPHVVIFDANNNLPTYMNYGIPFPLNNHVIDAWRARYGCSFVGIMSDAYGRLGRDIAAYWKDSVDLCLAFEPSPTTRQAASYKIVVLPVPSPRKYFYPTTDKNYKADRICFIGTTFKYMRASTLAMLEKAGIPLYVRGGDRTSDCPSILEYSSHMRHSVAVVNFSARDNDLPQNEDLDCITARVYEVLNSGSVLLEQDNRSTEYFFTPYAHYLPFKSMDELVFLSKFLLANTDIADELARRGAAFAQRYSDRMFWGRILKHMDQSAQVASPEAGALSKAG